MDNKIMELPINWILSSLGEICTQPQYGYTTKGSNSGNLKLLRTTDITSGNICWENVPFCLENPADENKYILSDGDIVISRAGSVGFSFLLKNPVRAVFASYLIRFKPYINKQYFKYFLDSPYYWKEISENKLGIAVSNVNASKLKEIEIPLPPTNEQNRIVAKIEALFSELDKGIESFRTAREQLKIYRQALLKHAFSGKLTEQWREENQDKLETADALLQRIQSEREQHYQQQLKNWEATGKQNSKPKAPKTLPSLTAEELAKMPELPKGWAWVQLECLVTGIDQGWSPKCENFPASDEKWGVIKTTAVQHGKFLDEENKSLPKDLKPRDQHKLNLGDILITRAGPRVRVGVCCLVRKVRENLMNCDKVYRIRSLEGVCRPDYIEANLNSPRILDEIEKIKTGINDSGVNLNQGAFLRLAVPYCSLTEQELVLMELDRKLSITIQLDQTLTTALQQTEALRQSILKKAFSGQLVPQDPNDEPASVLLERIQAEKAALLTQAKTVTLKTQSGKKINA